MRIAPTCPALLPAIAGLFAGTAAACPFCAAPSLTLSEQVGQADVAVIGAYDEATEATADSSASSTFLKIDTLRGDAPHEITVPSYRSADPGDLFLLLASNEEPSDDTPEAGQTLRWSGPVEITEAAARYIKQTPPLDAPQIERLGFFLKFLEHDDQTVATDAYSEFAGAPYDAVVPLSDQMPVEKLRKWITDGQVTPTRLGLYGMMLGLCGEESDADLMFGVITKKTDEFRLGIDGIMGGYMLLTGEQGLEKIEKRVLLSRDVPFNETYAAMQALRFLWKYTEGAVPKPRLKQSMRLLLERPDLADLVIADLARWKDWSLIPSLDSYYDREGYEVPAIKRAIIRFYLTAEATDVEPPSEEQREAATKKLADLKDRDPKTFRDAKRFFFLPQATPKKDDSKTDDSDTAKTDDA